MVIKFGNCYKKSDNGNVFSVAFEFAQEWNVPFPISACISFVSNLSETDSFEEFSGSLLRLQYRCSCRAVSRSVPAFPSYGGIKCLACRLLFSLICKCQGANATQSYSAGDLRATFQSAEHRRGARAGASRMEKSMQRKKAHQNE